MTNKFLVVANWKANEPPNYSFTPPENLEVAIAAPAPLVSAIPDNFIRAAQDVSQFPKGAETGEVPAEILKNLGVKYCLVGHSERRKLLGETNETVQKKIDHLKSVSIIPIVCARTLEDIPNETLRLDSLAQGDLLVMYEPEEAISSNGQYHPETPENINKVLADWQTKLPTGTRFLYGGSVNTENCKLITENCELVSGFVIGHASLDSAVFTEIIRALSKK